MVELRKRKTPPPAPVRPTKKKPGPKGKAAKVKKAVGEKVSNAVAAVKDAVGANGAESEAQRAPAGPAPGAPKVGETITLEGFGGEVETQDGKKVTLKQLVEESKDGVVIFTYPKASTPGCTTQACAFRDGYETLTSTGLSIYGLSSDGPKANITFKTKQSLPYTLLCDPKFTLISAIGLTTKPDERKTKRGVFVVDKSGKVLIAETGGPLPTVDAVKKLVDSQGRKGVGLTKEPSKEEKESAETAGEVADTAAKLDAPA